MLNVSYCSDKYQYTMGKSFFESGMKDRTAVFNLFFRNAPDGNGWAVVSGVKEALEMISSLGSEEVTFFEKFLPGEEYGEYRRYLAGMKFTGRVYAMKEGEIVFPKEPVMTIVGPLIEAQVLETPLLCIMNHQMAIATKASRVTRAAAGKPVSEFGSRRAHGPWASQYGGKAAVIGGCANTSNILTAIEFGLPSSGTMAHSFTTAFGCSMEGEYKAFDTYVKTHRGEGLILLIDTYDTLKCGLPNAIKAFRDNGIDDTYRQGYGIRLDSGDLCYLSRKCREILDNAGMKGCRIFATNSLDEYIIQDLEKQGARIDCFGVGDAIATSRHNPCFGNVYKLVQIDGEPVLKRSEDKGKLTNPGFQVTYRIIQDGKYKADVTCLRGDSTTSIIEKGLNLHLTDEVDETKYTTYYAGTYTFRILQEKVYDGGIVNPDTRTLEEKRSCFLDNLSSFNETQIRILNPHYYKVDISDDLYDLKMGLVNRIIQEINANSGTDGESGGVVSHVVVDMLYDFIDGSLACEGALQAVEKSVQYINAHPDQKVFYIADHHPANHCSFKENGGIWPAHCVMQTRGGGIHGHFSSEVALESNRPCEENTFFKGINPVKEQYSGFEAHDRYGIELQTVLGGDVVVSGIATEYCVRETCYDLVKAGHSVTLLSDALGYVSCEGHRKTLNELRKIGVKIV